MDPNRGTYVSGKQNATLNKTKLDNTRFFKSWTLDFFLGGVQSWSLGHCKFTENTELKIRSFFV